MLVCVSWIQADVDDMQESSCDLRGIVRRIERCRLLCYLSNITNDNKKYKHCYRSKNERESITLKWIHVHGHKKYIDIVICREIILSLLVPSYTSPNS